MEMRVCLCLLSAIAVAAATFAPAAAETLGIVVDAAKPGPRIDKMHYGIFFEEVNHAGDGGLWAEMIRNRSFEDSEKPDNWQVVSSGGAVGEIAIDQSKPLNANNTRSLKVTVKSAGDGLYGVANAGYWTLPLRQGAVYNVSLFARRSDDFGGRLVVRLVDAAGSVYAIHNISGLTADWRKYSFSMKPSKSSEAALLSITADKPGTFWLDSVSMMPADAKDGFRPDLLALLKGLKPGFVRFPGGCYVEGEVLKNAWRWKLGIGPDEARANHWNLWGYWDNNSLGLYEYLVLCERLGAEPLLVVNCGMSHQENVPMDKLDEYIQDALDAIEYANGAVSSKWGAERVRAGHPKPFGLKYMEVGNENGGPVYDEHYEAFYKALKAKYPNVTLVANTPVTRAPMDIVDEHYYNSPDFFSNHITHYDNYKRGMHKIYVGEYAVVSDCGTKGNLRAALGEAMFMIGMERNADVVAMASYAPLFVNENDRRWSPDMIPFDAKSSYGIPSYYVQKLFSENRGDVVMPTQATGPMRKTSTSGGIGLGTWATRAEFADIKVTSGSKTLYASDFASSTQGWKKSQGDWSVEDGVLKQASDGTDCRYVYSAPDWADYTLTLRARKISGAEGFLIMFRAHDDKNFYWWNLGGWGNIGHNVERSIDGARSSIAGLVPGKVEPGKWYDIKIEVQGDRIKCYLDGALIHDIVEGAIPMLGAITTKDTNGDILLKAVNRTGEPLDVPVTFNGLDWASAKVKLTLLTSGSDADENNLEQPKKVHPIEKDLGTVMFPFRQVLPPYSLSVFRLTKGK
jgi:alpha-L-arabinofuranosidase